MEMKQLSKANEERLIFCEPDGKWGIKGMNEKNQDEKMYAVAAKLKEYEALGLTPDQIREVDRLYSEKCREVAELKKSKWIPVTERLPEEHDSTFAKFYGTDKWTVGMFRKISDYVNVTAEYESGRRRTNVAYTVDGKWMSRTEIVKVKYIAWMPMPEPYEPESVALI